MEMVPTSVLNLDISYPAVTLSMLPTIDALAKVRDRGREASGVQTSAPGVRANTEDEAPNPFHPPTTTNA